MAIMSAAEPLSVFDASQTAGLLDFADLVDALAQAAVDYAAGNIQAPERQVVPFAQGGVMLSMPATAHAIGIHKLANLAPAHQTSGLPTINRGVSIYNVHHAPTLALLDGPTLTTP